MTKEQKEFIGYDYGFALLPYSFSEAVRITVLMTTKKKT